MPDKPNKSAEIRAYAAANPEAKARAIADALNGKGLEVTPAFVSAILSKGKNKNGKAPRTTVPDAVVDDVFTAIEIVNKAQEQEVTLEEFVDSLDLKWASLDDITSMKQLKDLKSRRTYGAFKDRYGKANAVKLLKKVKAKLDS